MNSFRQLLVDLTGSVPALSRKQIIQYYLGGDASAFGRLMRTLKGSGLVEMRVLPIRRPGSLLGPLSVYHGG